MKMTTDTSVLCTIKVMLKFHKMTQAVQPPSKKILFVQP